MVRGRFVISEIANNEADRMVKKVDLFFQIESLHGRRIDWEVGVELDVIMDSAKTTPMTKAITRSADLIIHRFDNINVVN